MITTIGYAVVIFCLIFCGVAIYNFLSGKSTDSGEISSNYANLSENDLVKKFNSLVSTITTSKNRNIDTIANELKEVLKEYKCRKVEQFVETEQLLAKNKNHIKEEIAKLDEQITKLQHDAKMIADGKDHLTEDDLETGALIMSQISETKNLKEQLQKTYDENDQRFNEVDKKVKQFNVRYTLKESSISNMIVMAKTHKSISTVDLKLNDLISEFKDKVQDAEIEYNVKSEINGTKEEEETSVDFKVNKDKYVEDFKNFLGK